MSEEFCQTDRDVYKSLESVMIISLTHICGKSDIALLIIFPSSMYSPIANIFATAVDLSGLFDLGDIHEVVYNGALILRGPRKTLQMNDNLP